MLTVLKIYAEFCHSSLPPCGRPAPHRISLLHLKDVVVAFNGFSVSTLVSLHAILNTAARVIFLK